MTISKLTYNFYLENKLSSRRTELSGKIVQNKRFVFFLFLLFKYEKCFGKQLCREDRGTSREPSKASSESFEVMCSVLRVAL